MISDRPGNPKACDAVYLLTAVLTMIFFPWWWWCEGDGEERRPVCGFRQLAGDAGAQRGVLGVLPVEHLGGLQVSHLNCRKAWRCSGRVLES